MLKTEDHKQAKVLELAHMAATIRQLKDQGKKVVLCHGVFDLLHPGHIRHFVEAKKLGDVLVVTITADDKVNKGPGRPAFHEDLRAEVLSALAMIDYVSVSPWQNAVELIKLLQPNFYVKGSDYKDPDKDVTGGIALEQSAIESVGGQLAFTDEIVFSSSKLINRYAPTVSVEASEYLTGFRAKYSGDEIGRYLEGAGKLKVLVIGEAIIDEYQYCQAIGKSSKEPMLAVKKLNEEKFVGGILAVGNHVSNFSGKVSLLTSIGGQDSQSQFIGDNLNKKIKASLLVRKDAPTIVKRRFIEGYYFTKMLEIYTINDREFEADHRAEINKALQELVPQADVVIVVDFGHGLLNEESAQIIASQAKYLALNVQSNASSLGYQSVLKYGRADYLCITESEARVESRARHGDIQEILSGLSKSLNCKRAVVTQGKAGCLCYSAETGFVQVPSLAAEVVDRMGAGDAFLSVTALSAVQGAPPEVIGLLGNCVGAMAVATVGHRSSVEKVPLMKFVNCLLK